MPVPTVEYCEVCRAQSSYKNEAVDRLEPGDTLVCDFHRGSPELLHPHVQQPEHAPYDGMHQSHAIPEVTLNTTPNKTDTDVVLSVELHLTTSGSVEQQRESVRNLQKELRVKGFDVKVKKVGVVRA